MNPAAPSHAPTKGLGGVAERSSPNAECNLVRTRNSHPDQTTQDIPTEVVNQQITLMNTLGEALHAV